MMNSLSIGLSGLLVHQRLIDLTGQNISNADNPTYHRQVGDLSAGMYGSAIGTGVELKDISRMIDTLLQTAIGRNTSAQSDVNTQLDGLNQLQAILAPGDGSLHDTLVNFFDAAEQLSAQPDNLTQRRIFLNSANELADRLNATTDNFNQMRDSLVATAKDSVDQINAMATQVAYLNDRIHSVMAVGGNANMLLDQRDAAISKLSEIIDVRTVPQPYGQVNVLVGGAGLVLNSTTTAFHAALDSQNQLQIYADGLQGPVEVAGGSLGGTLSLANTTLPTLRSQFDAFAQSLVANVDAIQASGLGLNGPMTSLTSQRTVNMVNMPLAAAGLSLPVKAGDVYVTMTDQATGQRTLNKVSIDPTTQSLTSIAGTLSTIPNLQAVVDAQAGTINLIAAPGFAFDFTGNVSTNPDTQTITGTATATLGGTYTGNINDALTYTVIGSGMIGSTPGLSVEVRNGAGTLLNTLNIGQGYEAGSELPAVLGIKAKIAFGTVNNGDTFSVNVAANPDTVGLLPALGLHSFFVGDDASGLHVNPDLVDHPENLAFSRTGQPEDGSNIAKLVTLRDAPALSNGSQTFQQFLEAVIGNLGAQAQDAQTRKSALGSLGQQLDTQRQGVSGVDPNEELMKLVQFQRGYQLSAKFVSTVNQTMDDLLGILG